MLCGQRIDIANLDVGRLYAWLFGARTEKPAPSPDHTRAVKSVAGDQKLHEVSAAQVWTYYSALGCAIDSEYQHRNRMTEIIVIKLVVPDAMQAYRCPGRYHEIECGAGWPPFAEWGGNPPGAIRS